GDQNDRADDCLERHVMVEQKGKIETDGEFEDTRDAGVEQCVEDRKPEHRIVPQPYIVFQAHEISAAADAGVGETKPDAEAERVGEKEQEEGGGRQHEPEAEPVAVDLEPIPSTGLAQQRFQGDVSHPVISQGVMPAFAAGMTRLPCNRRSRKTSMAGTSSAMSLPPQR